MPSEKIATMKLLRPNIVDEYKYIMNNVDMYKQLRIVYRFYRRTRKKCGGIFILVTGTLDSECIYNLQYIL